MRLTILGTGTAKPVPDTAASGVLVRTDRSSVLFDIGSGIASKLETQMPADELDGLVIGHLHADHWIDVAPLRYRFPWGEPAARRLPVRLPKGGLERLEELAHVISERPHFFEPAFDAREYADGETMELGDLRVTPHATGHYVPAWSMDIHGPDGARIVYAGDMGPSDAVVELARGADLLILEATLDTSRYDDVKRGHLTAEEAIDHAVRAGVPRAVLVHYPSERRAAIQGLCAATDGRVVTGLTGMTIEVNPGRVGAAAPTGAPSSGRDQETVRSG